MLGRKEIIHLGAFPPNRRLSTLKAPYLTPEVTDGASGPFWDEQTVHLQPPERAVTAVTPSLFQLRPGEQIIFPVSPIFFGPNSKH
jgi:hypothetical protein